MCLCDLESKKNLDKNSKERPFWVQGLCMKHTHLWQKTKFVLFLYLSENFDEEDVEKKKISTRAVSFAAYTYYIKKIFGKGHLGKGNRVQAPSCVVDGIRENYRPENGETTGFLAVCKSEE